MSEADPISAPRARKPDWIRVKAPVSAGFMETKKLMRRLNLATVCEEAACPKGSRKIEIRMEITKESKKK